MKKMFSILLSLFVMITSLTGCQHNLEKYSETTINAGFDTMFQLIAYTENKEEFDRYFSILKDEAYKMHQLFDIYNEYDGITNIKTINDQAGIKPVKVDPLIIELLEESMSYSQKTKNYFDITLGSVLSVWHDYRERGKALNQAGKYGPSPSKKVLSDAKRHTGYSLLVIDKDASTVFLKDKEASLDVGAIAKGFAVEKIANQLEQQGLRHGIVNGGGNIRTINYKPDDSSFNVGITNPNSPSAPSLLTLHLEESMAIVTSGDYERYFIDEDGLHQHHIIDPQTLYPTQGVRSVTIIYPNSSTADILSTVFTIATLAEAEEMIKEFEQSLAIVWVFDTLQETNFNYIEKDGFYLYHTDNIKNFID